VIYKFANAKIVEVWSVIDKIEIDKQLSN